MSIQVRLGRDDELPALLALRHEVFCLEQGVPVELERDEHDAAATHLVAIDEGEVVGTCRLLADTDAWRLGRMAVRRDRRSAGVGRRLLDLAHDEGRRRGVSRITLAAQLPVQGFYSRHGYSTRGQVFMEAGIPHVMMDRPLD